MASQAFAAFTIDYDEDAKSPLGGLHGAITFFRLVPNSGMPLAEAFKISGVNGTGRSGYERHRLVEVEPKRKGGGDRLVKLTPFGTRVRDTYPTRVVDIEKRWRSQFGAGLVKDLRASLEALNGQLNDDLSDYLDVSRWLRRPNSRRR